MADTFLTDNETAALLQLAAMQTAVSADHAPDPWSGRREYLVDASGGAIAFDLPSYLACAPGAEAVIALVTADNDLAITPAAGQTINGSATPLTLATAGAAYHLIRTPTGWLILNRATP